MRSRVLVIVVLVLIATGEAQATWYGENVGDGADIMMMDLRYPWWGESTYNAHWNFVPVSDDNFSGYGGFTMGVNAIDKSNHPNHDPEVQAAYRPGSVWSFWGSSKDGEPVRVVESSRYCYPAQYIGEGASGALGGPSWPFVTSRKWYTVMMRIWRPVDEDADCSYIGRWVKDVENDRWYLYGIVRLPTVAATFRGNAGFLEDYWNAGRSVRALHRRLGYYRKDGEWLKSDTVSFNVPAESGALNTYWVVNKLENNTVLAMELSGNKAVLPQKLEGEPLPLGETHKFTIDQPGLPQLDEPAIRRVKALWNGKQVLVSWEVPDSAAPQFQYTVEVFDNSACAGAPVAAASKRMPTARSVLIDATVKRPKVRVSLTDVFDQAIEPVVIEAEQAREPNSQRAFETAPGLEYELLVQETDRHVNVHYPPSEKAPLSKDERHFWVALDELNDGELVQKGISRGFDTALRGKRTAGYGFRFRGMLDVPRTGIYLFHMAGTDGYRIGIDGTDVLVWDGLHGPERKTFALSLAAGPHPLEVDYFVDKQQPFFELEWQGPDLPRQQVPRSALLHQVGDPVPEMRLTAEPHPDGTVSVSVDVHAHGHEINRIQLHFDTMQIAEASGPSLKCTELLPAGEHDLWARVFYDGNTTIDSSLVPVQVASEAPEGWQLGVAGEADDTRNISQPAPDAFTFVGEGEYVIYREVEGDFTLSCCVTQCLGLNDEPVNPSSWVGLSVREKPGENSYRWGREFGLMQTAKAGLRTTPDFSDLGGTRMSFQALPHKSSWLRVVRKGTLWTAWVSQDGKRWTLATTHHKPMPEKVGAGVVFRALPQDAQMYFRAKVTDLLLEREIPDDFEMPAPLTAEGVADADLTGVVVAVSDPSVVVARSSRRGILRSDDAGETWGEANGSLAGAANAVRSVAIHPTDPSVMFRAAGRADEAGVFEGGLYRTEDAGATWTKLEFDGDFDGLGPSALCGEIIDIVPSDPDIVLVGCETKGLYRSTDGGKSWTQAVEGPNRFTAVKIHPWHFHENREPFVHALTAADRFMPVLGRGEPAMKAEPTLSRDYVSHSAGETFAVHTQRSDLGYLNIAYRAYHVHEAYYGTTHGLLHTFSDGRESYLYGGRHALESRRPITAMTVSRVTDLAWPRMVVQALSPDTPGRVSVSDSLWRWGKVEGAGETGVIALSAGDRSVEASGDVWWMLTTEGLYRSDDGMKTVSKKLE